MKRIHVWAQSYNSNPGGIQTFTRFVVQALCDLYPDAKIVVFAKNDRPETEATSHFQVRCLGGLPAALRAAAFALSAVRHARRDQPDLIISTHVNLAPVARLAQKFTHARFIVVGHGIEVWKIHKASVRAALQAGDQLVAVSDFTRMRMAGEIGVAKEKIDLLANTFDAERFKPGPKPPELLQRYKLTNDQPILLTVARLETTEQYKGYDNVLLAMPEILGQFPAARYVIVGEGPDRARIEALIRKLHIASQVIMAGYVPNDSLPDHYNLCDVFAMPSKGEGFGIVFLEALACGKPVVAGDKDASSEALLNGRLGRLVDPDDENAIGAAVCSVLSDIGGQTPEAGSKEADRLRSEVVAAFGYERFKERLGEIVGKILAKKSGDMKTDS